MPDTNPKWILLVRAEAGTCHTLRAHMPSNQLPLLSAASTRKSAMCQSTTSSHGDHKQGRTATVPTQPPHAQPCHQDGDLDANWVESMNSVMDDSRLLTLPSNERIRLLPHMKVGARARQAGLQP
jgi:hypothetical protein